MTSKTTIETIGNKEVNIRTYGSERMRISVLLCIRMMVKSYHLS